MSQGGYVTLVGFVAQDPNIRTTATGKLVTKVRVGTTPRYRDSATGQWRDAETSYFNVSCWARLADHVRASLHKGDPVIVKGRFRTSTFEDKNGQPRTAIEITADTVGHDLSRAGQLHPPAASAREHGRRPSGRRVHGTSRPARGAGRNDR